MGWEPRGAPLLNGIVGGAQRGQGFCGCLCEQVLSTNEVLLSQVLTHSLLPQDPPFLDNTNGNLLRHPIGLGYRAQQTHFSSPLLHPISAQGSSGLYGLLG